MLSMNVNERLRAACLYEVKLVENWRTGSRSLHGRRSILALQGRAGQHQIRMCGVESTVREDCYVGGENHYARIVGPAICAP